MLSGASAVCVVVSVAAVAAVAAVAVVAGGGSVGAQWRDASVSADANADADDASPDETDETDR